MRKTLIVILTVILALSSIALIACNASLVEIEFKTETVPVSVEQGTEIDYSKIIILAKYDNGTVQEIALTAKGVAFSAINTESLGPKTITVTFNGKSAQCVITVTEKQVPDTVTIAFKSGTVPTSVNVGDVIDYSSIKIVVTHTVGETEEIALTAAIEGLEYDPIDTSAVGTKELVVRYLGKTCKAAIIVADAPEPDEVTIKFKTGTVPMSVAFGSVIDYSQIILIVERAGSEPEEIALTASVEGLEYDAIDTSVSGTQELVVRYLGKTCKAGIVVEEEIINPEPEITIGSFDNTAGYNAYLTAKGNQAEARTQFTVQNNPYEVGVVNGYRLVPQVTYIDEEGESHDSFSKVKTTYVVYLKNGDSYELLTKEQEASYIDSVSDNVYYFNSDAVGAQLKIEVTLSDEYGLLDDNMSKTITQEFKLVDGYNVYDALGLSVLDNLNVKSWASIKNSAPLEWDGGRKLNEFYDVKQVVIHNNIEVTVDDLPANYFWVEGEDAVVDGDRRGLSYADVYSRTVEKMKKYLPGSLKETFLGEAWEGNDGKRHRGLYMTDGIGISGNYLKLSYKSGLDASGNPTGRGIYVAWDYNSRQNDMPEGHVAFVSYRYYEGITNENPNGTGTVSNVYFVGQTQKTENVDLPTALIMVSGNAKQINVVNTIGTQWYLNGVYDGRQTVVSFKDSKLFESFGQMIMTIRIVGLNIENCEMRESGGPMLIIQTSSAVDADDPYRSVPTVVNIDDASRLENWVTANANWFAVNGIPETFADAMLSLAKLPMANGIDSSFVKVEGDITYYNLLGVLIPSPDELQSNQYKLEGSMNIGKDGNVIDYGMTNKVFDSLVSLHAMASTGQTLAEGIGQTALATGFKQLADSTSSLRIAPIFASGNSYATTTNNTNFVDIISMLQGNNNNITQLYQGSLAAAAQLKDSQSALAARFEEVAAALKPIVDAGTLDSAAWNDNWKNTHIMSLWVNPDFKNPETSVKHFMILFGDQGFAQA